MIYDLSNLLKIGGKDAWINYHAFLGERNGESKNYNSLMRIPAVKELTVVDFHERNGVELSENLKLSFKAIERSLQFWIIEKDKAALGVTYNAFMSAITNGKIEIDVIGWGHYDLIYQEMIQQPEMYEEPGRIAAALFTIKFLEPNPTV